MDFLCEDEPELDLGQAIMSEEINSIEIQDYIPALPRRKKTVYDNRPPKERWYQNYSMSEKYCDPNESPDKLSSLGDNSKKAVHSPNQEISAVEFINWVNNKQGIDCRPKLYDNLTKSYLLCDTGAMTTCVPKEAGDKIDKLVTLRTADGKPMKTYGKKEIHLRIGRKTYAIWAIVTDVTQTIIGMDFFNKYQIGFDWLWDELYLVDKKASIRQKLSFVTISRGSMPTVKMVAQKTKAQTDPNKILFEIACIKKLAETTSSKANSDLNKLLKKVPQAYREIIKDYDILKPNYKVKPKHNIIHRIETSDNSPCTSKVRAIPANKLEEVKRLWTEMENSGVITKVGANTNTNWSSALHVVTKNGQHRICVDYRALNTKILNDSYPLPLIKNISQQLHSAQWFTKLDLKKAYWNVPIFNPHKHKSTVVTPWGAYYFNRLPFGIKSAPNSYQKGMETIFKDIPNLYIYLDDLLIHTETLEEHQKIVKEVLKRLHENGMALSLDKCVWQKKEVEYLGYLISEKGLIPLPKKVEALDRIQPPSKQKYFTNTYIYSEFKN